MDVVYRFTATGAGSVESAFLGIEAAARRSKRAVEESGRSTDKALRAPTGGGGRGGGGRGDRAYAEAEKLAAKIEREDARDAKSAKRAADARIREAERASNYVGKIRDRQMLADQRAEEKSERAKARAAERISADRYKSLGRLAKDATMAALTGGFAASMGIVGSAARESMQTQDIANRVSINSRGTGQTAVDPTTLRKEFEAAAIATPGIKASDIGEATQAYVDLTGDLKTARENMVSFATVASASGSTVQDVATAAASLGSKFNVKSLADMQKVMALLVAQGKGGALTLKDQAAQFQKLAAAGAAFGLGKGPDAVAKLGGLMQIARQGTKSPQSAGTAVENIFSALTAKSGKLAAAGVHVYNKDGSKRDIDEVLAETISKVGGSNLERKNAELGKLLGKQGIRGVNPLISAYTDAAAGKTGEEAQKAGYDAVLAALHKASDATSDWSEVQKDAAQAQTTATAQLDAAWESVKATVGDQAIPALLSVVPKLAGLAGAIDPAVTVFVALVEAAGLVIDAFKFLGLIKPKEQTPQERLITARKDLDAFQTKLDARTHMVTPEEAKEKWRLQDAVKAAEAVATTTTDVAHGKKTASMTPEEFARQYTEASGESFGTEGRWADAEYKAKKLAAEIQKSPNMLDPGNENDAQRAIREKFAADSTFEKGRTDKGGDMVASGQGIKDLDAAAAAAAKVLQQFQAANQPSIAVGG